MEYTSASHAKKDKSIERHRYNIELKLTEFEGTAVNVKYPSKFLNEARMTALAFVSDGVYLITDLGKARFLMP